MEFLGAHYVILAWKFKASKQSFTPGNSAKLCYTALKNPRTKTKTHRVNFI